jgi:hypothetical protein
MAFSATDAAFEGFRLARRQPLTAAGLSIVQLILGIIIPLIMIKGGFQEIMAAGAAPTPGASPQESLAFLQKILALEATFIPVIVISSVIAAGAVYRGVLRPTDGGWILGLKLGADELRLFLVSLAKGLLFMGAGLACAIVLVIITAILGAAFGRNNGVGVAGLVFVVGYLALIGFMIFLAVRLSLAGPATVADQRFRLLSTWSLTKGRFWPLLGCYVLAFVLYVLVAVIMYAVCALLVFVLSGFHFDVVALQMFKPDFSSVAGYFTPLRIVIAVVTALVAGVLQMVILAPAAEAWRQVTGADSADTFA